MISLAHLRILALLVPLSVNAFYLPGAAPHNYREGEPVNLFVNALTPMLSSSDDAKLKSLINYDYYNPKFHFCQPADGEKKQPESLGSILFGDRIFNSPYNITMLQDNATCKTLCTAQVPGEDAKFINDRIREDYALNWLIDGLPAAEMKVDLRSGDLFFDMGFNLGNDDGLYKDHPALNNHYEIVLRYHTPSPEFHRVVGVLVWPSSVSGSSADCDTESKSPMILSDSASNTVKYTYRVTWNVGHYDSFHCLSIDTVASRNRILLG